MDERALRVNKEHVRNPNFLHQATVEGHALVVGAWKGKPLVLPVMTQVQRHGKVLQGKKKLECYKVFRSSLYYKLYVVLCKEKSSIRSQSCVPCEKVSYDAV